MGAGGNSCPSAPSPLGWQADHVLSETSQRLRQCCAVERQGLHPPVTVEAQVCPCSKLLAELGPECCSCRFYRKQHCVWCSGQEHRPGHLSLNPDSATYQLCDLGQVYLPPYAPFLAYKLWLDVSPISEDCFEDRVGYYFQS